MDFTDKAAFLVGFFFWRKFMKRNEQREQAFILLFEYLFCPRTTWWRSMKKISAR